MKRIATVGTVLAALTLGLASSALAATGNASAAPSFGVAGTAIELTISGFTPGSTFEVHGGALDGPLLGTGTTSAAGEGSVGVTIPSSAPVGDYTLAVCETTFVGCTDTTNDFWVGATATVLVVAPPPTTTGIPDVVLGPDLGEAGSTTTVSISGFTPGSTFEVHIGEWGSGLLGSSISSGIGEGAVVVRVPDGIGAGELTILVCETQFVACNDTTSDFWVGATAAFTVIAPPPPAVTTTTTAAPAPTTAAEPETTTTTAAASAEITPTSTAGEDGVAALPTSQESTDDSGSNLWWLLLIVLGAALLGSFFAWRMRRD